MFRWQRRACSVSKCELENLRQVVNEMNKQNSQLYPNAVITAWVHRDFLAGEKLQQDVFRWLSPPDPSKMYSFAPRVDVTSRDTVVWTPPHQTSGGGQVELAQLLIEHGAEAAARDPNGSIPVRPAPEGRHLELARLLTEHGTNSKVPDSNGSKTQDLVSNWVD